MFLVRSETYAINRAAITIQDEIDSKGWDDANHTVLWESAYSILPHAANLSKIFWPSRERDRNIWPVANFYGAYIKSGMSRHLNHERFATVSNTSMSAYTTG